MNNDWPPDSVPSKGTTHSVRGSVTTRRTGRKWTRFFSALVCRLHNGGLHQDGSVLRLVGGKEGSSKQVSKQVSAKFQVSSGFEDVFKFTIPPSKKTDQRCPIYARR